MLAQAVWARACAKVPRQASALLGARPPPRLLCARDGGKAVSVTADASQRMVPPTAAAVVCAFCGVPRPPSPAIGVVPVAPLAAVGEPGFCQVPRRRRRAVVGAASGLCRRSMEGSTSSGVGPRPCAIGAAGADGGGGAGRHTCHRCPPRSSRVSRPRPTASPCAGPVGLGEGTKVVIHWARQEL